VTGQFADRVALVTGAASGIGRASSLAFAREGARVVLADVDAAGGEESVGMIEAAGGEATFVKTDVTSAADVQRLVDQAVETYGRLDCAHNNAGVLGNPARTADCSEEEWDRIIAINLKGVWLCMRAEIPQMLAQGGGAIVNTASSAGLTGMPRMPAYVASKHGVAGVTKAAALDYAKKNIRVNAVCPGFIDTPLVQRAGATQAGADKYVPTGRIGRPEEVAEAVIWLCSDAASYVTGLCMAVDGAMTAQ
jgi:NAD(P)-dependent dehydrogenase (short-subunit alcohol dehydrogenase family)